MRTRIVKAFFLTIACAIISVSAGIAQGIGFDTSLGAVSQAATQPGVNVQFAPIQVPVTQSLTGIVQGPNPVLPIARPRLDVPTGPITVAHAVDLALANNTSYQAALERTERARSVAAENRGLLLSPQVRGSVVYTRQKEVSTVFSGPAGPQTITIVRPSSINYGLNLSQPIDITGVLRATVDVSRLSALIQEIDLRRVRQQVALETRTAFFNVIRARQLVRVTQEALAAAEEHLRVARQQFEAGTVPQFDVLRAEVQVANFQQTNLSAQNTANLAEAALNLALGLPGGFNIQLTEPPAPETMTLDIDQSIMAAQKNRPEVQEALTNVALARRGIAVARRGILPSLALSSNYSVTPTAGAFGSETSWNIVAALSVPIFDSGVTRARVQQARNDVAIAQTGLDQTQQGISLEVRQAVLNYQDAKSRLDAAQANLRQAREALRLANVRFEAGVSTQVEVTDAQVAFSQAETNYVNALNDVRLAIARYDRAIGTPV